MKKDVRKGADLADNLARVKELYPLCKDFERTFPSLAFALATGVGKTRLMARSSRGFMRYCQKATTWAKANGYKPWTHLFIPDDEVRSERLLADYVNMFTVTGT